jgi:hypothetical protein
MQFSESVPDVDMPRVVLRGCHPPLILHFVLRLRKGFCFQFRSSSVRQDCQIFIGTTYQNWQKYTKFPQNIPNSLKIGQMALQFTNIIFHCKTLPRFLANLGIFGLKICVPSGNPGVCLASRSERVLMQK